MQNNDIEIKRIGAEDAAMLSVIATKAYSEHYSDTWKDEGAWYIKTYFSITYLKVELEDGNAWFYIVYSKNEAAGFLKLNINKALPGGEINALELERIYLTKSAGGKGIGTFLIQFVYNIAVQKDKKAIWLKVMDTSPDAIRFYERMGFVICGTHQVDFIQKKESMRGMYIMQKKV